MRRGRCRSEGDSRRRADRRTSDALLRVFEASGLDAAVVLFQQDGSAHVTIRRSKTDQHGEGAVRDVAPAAAKRLRNWMVLPGIESGPLFRPVPGHRVGKGRLPEVQRAGGWKSSLLRG